MSESADISSAPPATDITGLADHLFRHEAGRLVSVLTSIFGMERLQMAEDVVQEALIKALKTWPYYGVPKNPAAWLTQTAKNLALDLVRREKNFHEKQPQIIAFMEQWTADADDPDSHDHEIKDERLRLMFACCHPEIPADAQIALALKTLCGFSPAEIAKAFLSSEAAIAKRLVRARQRIRELEIQFEIPTGEASAARLESVMQTLYLLFNEGYKASSGENLIREELCEEAIRLTTLLVSHPVGNQPRVHALAALMYLNAARLKARMDTEGNILLLKDQDRSRWDRSMVARGILHLSRSATGEDLSEYHLQAGIAACHGTAKDYQSTDWAQILSLYDRLIEFDDSPVIALNRAVALSNVQGPSAGIAALEAIRNRQPLDSYYLFYAVRADFEVQLNRFQSAGDHLRKALELTEVKSEQSLLSRRLQECEQQAVSLKS